MTTGGAHRAWRAACPSCGAPVEFASAASASAVCSFCRSTLVRDGEALRRIGVSSELFDDHSPLQLGVAGRYDGVAFMIVGRLQLGYADGTWNEWHALFDNGRSGWLSEDNGAYVFAFETALPAELPAIAELRAGQRRAIAGVTWDVASVVRARLVAAQGELPSPPRLDGDFAVADLRNPQGEVATIDESDPAKPHWSIGRSVLLGDLALQGLREIGEKTLAARGVECPSCGAALEVKLASTQSISCSQCQAVVDVSQGLGGELAHFVQNNSGQGGLEPQIPLGKSGTLTLGAAPAAWQVVGYLERCDLPAPGDDEEQVFWREYLLYEPKLGFAFLVDAEDGWSWMRPITGTPQVQGERAIWQGIPYQHRYTYDAKVTWVLGEFYWRVRRDERAKVSDYHSVTHSGQRRLSREQTAQELTWSAGATIGSQTVADAFGLDASQRAALQRDVAPLAAQQGKKGVSFGVILLFIAIFVLFAIIANCSGDDCDELRSTFGEASTEYRQCVTNRGSGSSRTGGGSYGGYSSGGGHK